MAWTTFADVDARWVGSGAPDDEELVGALIDDAEAVIVAAYPRIQERLDDDRLSLNVVKLVVVRMVMRILRNPEGLTYWQQQTGPFGQGRNFGSNADIWLQPDERAMLAPSKAGKAFSVDLAPDAVNPSRYDPVWERVGTYSWDDGFDDEDDD